MCGSFVLVFSCSGVKTKCYGKHKNEQGIGESKCTTVPDPMVFSQNVPLYLTPWSLVFYGLLIKRGLIGKTSPINPLSLKYIILFGNAVLSMS